MNSVGIEIGTSKSCMGLVELDKIRIIQNLLGEEIEPSVVSIINNKILVGENVYLNENSKFSNTIDEIKRLISYNFIYDNKFFEEYKKYLGYNIERTNENFLSVNIDGKDFSIEEILSFLIKQIVENGKYANIFVKKKFVFAVPSCFGLKEKELIRKSAKLANIDESKIEMINETSAAALAYELMINKSKYELKYDYDIYQQNYDNFTCRNLTSGPILNEKTKKNIFVFDLGEGCFNLSIISITENDDKKINFKVKANLGNPFFGGIDFDNKLVQYCVNKFCELNQIKEEDIYNNKSAVKRLKFRCKIAKQILNKNESVIIYIPNFIQSIDLCIEITRNNFENICSGFFIEINNKILKILKIANVDNKKIKEVLLIGGNSKIPRIIEMLKDIFGQEKIIDYIDTNKIVVTGAALYANETQKKNKKFFVNEVIASSFGINIINNDFDSFLKYGDKMFKLIKKNFSFPYISKFSFKCKVSKDNTIFFKIYEGESDFVKFNKKLGGILLSDLNESLENKDVKIDIIFELDKNYILKVRAEIPEINFKNEISIGNLDKSKLNNIKINLEKGQYNSELFKNKENLKEYSTSYTNYKDEERNKTLINCCKCCKEIYEESKIKYSVENRILKLYHLTEDLFLYYLERLKLKYKSINYCNEIIKEMKEKMRNLIDIEGFNEILKDIFKGILDLNKNLYFSIILNYIELIVSWNVIILKNNNQSKLYCFKIYYQKSEKILEEYSNQMKAYDLDEELLEKIEILRKINHCIKRLISNVNRILDEYQNLDNLKNEIKEMIHRDIRYSCLEDILKIIDDTKNIII